MAISAAICFEVRTVGSDLNGGGFKAGAAGTDWSQQTAAQYALTNGVTNGTTTIGTASAVPDMVGNLVYVAGGTGAVTGAWYEIVSQVTGVSITVDRSTGLTAGTGVTLNIGGALATINTAGAAMSTSNRIYVKADATYVRTATTTLANSAVPSPSAPHNRLIGYTTVRGDNGRVTVQLSTNTGLTGLNVTGSGWLVENFFVDCNSLGTSIGIGGLNDYSIFRNCKVANFKTAGITGGRTSAYLERCEVTGGLSGATAAINSTSASWNILRCYIHDNVCPGIVMSGQPGNNIIGNIIANNTGASSDGINANYGSTIIGNDIYGSGRHGINLTSGFTIGLFIKDNILTNNGASGTGYGLCSTNGNYPADFAYDGNAYYNNATGARNNLDNTAGQFGVAPYTNVLDVTLTGTPYANAAGGDFSLNTTAGAGAACRAAGTQKSWPGASTTGYPDLGAAQHQDPAGGGSNVGGVIF